MLNLLRRVRAVWLSVAVAVMATGPIAKAQDTADYPNKLVTIYVGYGAGGASDVTARLLASHMYAEKGAKVIVENKPGAGGRLAAEYMTRQKPDGYSLMVAGNGVISVAKAIYPNLNYDPTAGLTPIAIIAEFPNFILVVPSDHEVKTFAELVEWTKAHPDASNYPTPGPSYTIPTEQLKINSGLSGVAVSYRSGNEALMSVVTGESLFMLADPASAMPLLEGGNVRALAVTGKERLASMPDLPTLKELGFDVNMNLWTGLFAPAGVPADILTSLEAEVNRVARLPDVAEKLRGMALVPGNINSADYTALIAKEVSDYTATVKAAGLKFDE
ncbi:MAG TPA: tripartite tricarboxylate transporter substrate binding protein [Pararhizobium sp.]|uniref:Bug family tripartite tricarboxylate transporter substrate binding protein n=1 Tax=Pararhizobium sp. TaxID=1977563 RepID=UPI002B74949E|nr:tripartite tricarboxylate transporter substrate binding protein [Pararhizobium sp.]HTO34149.1 tripartite tricarboxylate transporter substrate binding protein [Pararhizobium sp.]